jgi:[acyl-carrier-protein] S-malonyltransferase
MYFVRAQLNSTSMKKAYVFPGQGAQFPGMAKSLYESNAVAKQMLEAANDILGFRITDIMFNGTPDELKATKVTQPAIFLHSVVLAKCYEGFQPDMAAGHSLGEFSALAAAQAIKFEDASQARFHQGDRNAEMLREGPWDNGCHHRS